MERENSDYIEGGYINLSRKLINSAIMNKPAEYLKVWIYILLKCNHKTLKRRGQTYKRGECLIESGEIERLLKYRRGFVSKSYNRYYVFRIYDFMRDVKMIATRKTTRGMFISVLNYGAYQNADNYERNNDFDMNATNAQHDKQECIKNDKQEVNNKDFEDNFRIKPKEVIKNLNDYI